MRIEDTQDQVKIILESQSERDHVDVFIRALNLYSQRRRERGNDGWRRYGYKGAAFFIKDRSNRLWDSVQLKRTIHENDVLDIMNYAVFCIRSHREDNYGGEFWPS